MKNNISLTIPIFLVAGLVMTGCASQVQKSLVMQSVVQREKLQNIEISIKDNPKFSASHDYSPSMVEFRRILQEKIASAFPDAKVAIGSTTKPVGPGLRISVTVVDFRYVSGATRFMNGASSGSARLRVKLSCWICKRVSRMLNHFLKHHLV